MSSSSYLGMEDSCTLIVCTVFVSGRTCGDGADAAPSVTSGYSAVFPQVKHMLVVCLCQPSDRLATCLAYTLPMSAAIGSNPPAGTHNPQG